jgi:hypothetical protein
VIAVLIWVGCGGQQGDVTAPLSPSAGVSVEALRQGLGPAIAAQERHTGRLLAIPGVVGTAVGFTRDGRPAVKILTRAAGTAGLPTSLDGIPVVEEATGDILAIGPPVGANGRRKSPGGGIATATPGTTEYAHPVPIGVSTGNVTATANCATGTIGARVKNASNQVYALSNNHVYALTNTAPIGSHVVQPGLYDDGCVAPETDNDAASSDVIGTLAAFDKIAFCKGRKCPANTIDAAIASSTTTQLGHSTPSGGYGTPTSPASATVGEAVEKYGRTTALTTGKVTGINASILVSYGSGRTALFVQQILAENASTTFLGAGDSGSLLVASSGSHAVGLLFAGNSSGTTGIANPIAAVLGHFGVTID